MDSNTYSTGKPQGLAALAADLQELAAQDPDGLPVAARAERVLELQGLVDRLQGQVLSELAAVDALGAAGAEQGQPAGSTSTAAWLRSRLRMGPTAAAGVVRTARALFRGPLTATGQALTDGAISAAHAQVLAHGTQHLPAHTAAEAEPVLVEAARRLDPPRLRRVVGHLLAAADPQGADGQAERHHLRRGLWVSPTLEGMVAVDGLLEAEAGQIVLAALEPLARPTSAEDDRSGSQRRADALCELARRNLEAGQLPQTGGVRPQLLVTVDLDSLLGHPGTLGGDAGWVGPLSPETCRRLACDGALTRVLVTRHRTDQHHPNHHRSGEERVAGPAPQGRPRLATRDPIDEEGIAARDPIDEEGLEALLRTTLAMLPPTLGGAPTQPLEVGRTSRVVTAAQRAALVVRDGGCAVAGCQRPPAWCEAHHLRHWLHGGPTDLDNLALVCRAHHRAVHEGGWRLTRDPDGRLTATPPHQSHHPAHRRHPPAA